MATFTYSLDGPHQIVLTTASTGDYLAEDPGVVEAVQKAAQTRADNTGHVCAVYADDRSTVLFQVRPSHQ